MGHSDTDMDGKGGPMKPPKLEDTLEAWMQAYAPDCSCRHCDWMERE